jgi:uncharacterized membrane protein YeaQ/YmgE (transglycosylase-associated protein family)
MLLSFVWFAIVGLICGAIARALFPGRHRMGLLATSLLGMAGSLLGGFAGSLLWGGLQGASIQPGGWILSIVGAMVVLYAVSRRR